MRTGPPNPDPRNNGSDKGPLRAIVGTIRADTGIFDRARVRLECGHEADATRGAVRARCCACKRDT
jgi:hypothetical protein